MFKDGKWEPLNVKKIIVEIVRQTAKEAKRFISDVIETTGQIRKRLGVEKVKIKKPQSKKEIQLKLPVRKVSERSKILAKWSSVINELKTKGYYQVSKNDHFGSLRGRDILKHAKRDLNKIGIKTKILFDDNHGGKLEKVIE